MTSERLLYDKLPMTSPPRKGQAAVIVDIAKLNADQGFGFNKYLPSDSNSSDDYHRQIFESPYFDYRRTHSRVMNNICQFLVSSLVIPRQRSNITTRFHRSYVV